jgi:hypothetical protein
MTSSKKEFGGANIANQIFDTIKRVLEPNDFTKLVKKPKSQVLASKLRVSMRNQKENGLIESDHRSRV